MKQLTLRAVIMGAFLGGFMSLSNLYIGLKTGWGLGVAITACILSYTIWKTLRTLLPFIFKSDMTILENNCMQSTASSAGYSTGGTMVSAISAYLIITGTHMSWTVLTLWTIFLAALGVFIAIPMKRQMINIEQLKFPSGIAAAETLKSLHSKGAEAADKARATGESDITPIGAMGKITQLTFGILAPTNMTTNLMTASVTAGAAGSTADLLTDLKSGYLLGANPRQQFIAQFCGIFAGTLIVVPAFYILVPDASVLGSNQWPAPSAQVWAAVAKLLSNGVHSLHPAARMGMIVGGIAGIIIPILELIFPKRRKYIPSAMGLGLAMVIPFWNSLSMFLGGLIALILEKKNKAVAEKYIIPVSSGIIAGESLMGVAIALSDARGMFTAFFAPLKAFLRMH
ncbi:MAG: OPT/YSL family transporter [Elusimicrobia bacterium]|nr:OPT/YSL family transporter [Elusimicrobiota bacterium]